MQTTLLHPSLLRNPKESSPFADLLKTIANSNPSSYKQQLIPIVKASNKFFRFYCQVFLKMRINFKLILVLNLMAYQYQLLVKMINDPHKEQIAVDLKTNAYQETKLMHLNKNLVYFNKYIITDIFFTIFYFLRIFDI